MAILQENIIEIEQPQTEQQWTTYQLENYNFNFWRSSSVIRKNWRLVLKILNKYLISFQYYTAIEEYEDINNKHTINKIFKIIIDDDIINSINNASIKESDYTFSKSILDYAGFICNLVKKSEWDKTLIDIKQNSQKRDQEYENNRKLFLFRKQEFENNILTNLSGGIYRICSISTAGDKELLYIGLTNKTFKTRWQQHLNIINGIAKIPIGMEKLYSLLMSKKNNYQLIMEPLVDFDKNVTNHELTLNEKEAMEYAFIITLQPPGNTAGIDVPYQFSENIIKS